MLAYTFGCNQNPILTTYLGSRRRSSTHQAHRRAVTQHSRKRITTSTSAAAAGLEARRGARHKGAHHFGRGSNAHHNGREIALECLGSHSMYVCTVRCLMAAPAWLCFAIRSCQTVMLCSLWLLRRSFFFGWQRNARVTHARPFKNG